MKSKLIIILLLVCLPLGALSFDMRAYLSHGFITAEPAATGDVRYGTPTTSDAISTGTLRVPAASAVTSATLVDATVGNYVTVAVDKVTSPTTFGPNRSLTGTATSGGGSVHGIFEGLVIR